MSFARTMSYIAVATTLALAACTDETTSPVNQAVSADVDDWNPRPPVFNQGCNGNNASQLRARRVTFRQPPLQRVIVYGSPVQRPYRGYGDSETYGGVTQTFTYDRDMLDQCSFGTDKTFEVGGIVEDDTLEVSDVAPEGVDQEVWNSVTPRVRKQLFEAAKYLAAHYITNDIPEIGQIAEGLRAGAIFAVLAREYNESLASLPDGRTATLFWHHGRPDDGRRVDAKETQRIDALLIGCSASARFRDLESWLPAQAEEWASRLSAAWAADQTQHADRYLEPQLTRLGAIGAQLGRRGYSCAQAAQHHFSSRPNDLYEVDPSGGGNQF